MEHLHRIYETILSDEISYFFCVLIVGWLIVAILIVLVRPFAQRRVAAKFLVMTPNSLATLGILGTFTGILIGLLDFDVNRVDESVPALLAGLKIAFTTSIVGIAAAITFRFIRTIAPSAQASEGVTPEDIHAALLEIRNDSRESAARSDEQLGELRKAISSEGDSSLLTQMQKLRTTVQDGQSDLVHEFREFAKHMVENNQKAIIEALESVIRDFNQNLTEQFGENFKQLNEAVHSLVVWQDKYREHVESLEQRLETAVDAVEAAQIALESVQRHSERIPEVIKPLEPVLRGINTQTEAMSAHLEAIAALRDKATEAFPIVEANLEKITTHFATSIEDIVSKSGQALADGEKAHIELRLNYEAFLKDASESRERFATELSNALKQMSEQSSQEFTRHGELIEATAKEAQKAINESWGQSVEKMNEQFNTFDQQMQQELTRALELLGRNLASVSEKLTSDYTPLTQQLQRLVRVGTGVS